MTSGAGAWDCPTWVVNPENRIIVKKCWFLYFFLLGISENNEQLIQWLKGSFAVVRDIIMWHWACDREGCTYSMILGIGFNSFADVFEEVGVNICCDKVGIGGSVESISRVEDANWVTFGEVFTLENLLVDSFCLVKS